MSAFDVAAYLEALAKLDPAVAERLAAWKTAHPALALSTDDVAALLVGEVTPEKIAAHFAEAGRQLSAFIANASGPVTPGIDPSVDV